ncbi:Uncharacterised protein [Mobiluncus mulieris]|nr:Uncharacterised protein [Mobiluncus mulieris]
MSMSAVDDKAAVAVEGAAGELRREFFSDELLDRLLDATSERGVELTGRGGFLSEFIKAVLERGMRAELTSHLGYEKHAGACQVFCVSGVWFVILLGIFRGSLGLVLVVLSASYSRLVLR